MYKEKIVNLETGEETWRDFSAEEIAQIEKNIEEKQKQALAEKEREAAREAIFEKLGLTPEEAQTLLS